MPILLRARVLFLVPISVLLGTATAEACCFGWQPTSLSELVDQHSEVVFAKRVGVTFGFDDQAGKTELVVLDVLKSESGRLGQGDHVTIYGDRLEGRGDTFLLLSSEIEEGFWERRPMTRRTYRYLRGMPSAERAPVRRGRYLLSHVESGDASIDEDAWLELSRMEPESLFPIADARLRTRLRHWLVDPRTDAQRLGIYGLLLGMCRDESDRELLERLALAPAGEDARSDFQGLISGYLLLAGSAGLDKLDARKILPTETSEESASDSKANFAELYAVKLAIDFLWTHGNGVIPQARLKESMRHFLHRPELCDLALFSLVTFRDWEVIDEVAALMQDERYSHSACKRAYATYLLRASNDRGRFVFWTPRHAKRANAHLKRLEQSDPEVVAQVRQFQVAVADR